MKRFRPIVLVSLFILLILVGYFGRNKNNIVEKKDIEISIDTDVGKITEITKEEVITEFSHLEESDKKVLSDNNDNNIERLPSVAISGNDEKSINSFATAYRQAKEGNDSQKQLVVLEKLYKKKKADKLLPFMIRLAVQVRAYDKALHRVSILENKGILLKMLDETTLFNLLFNGLSLSFKDINRIKEFMIYYESKGYIDNIQLFLYESLITYSRGDMDNYSYFMDRLKNSKYEYWFLGFKENKKTVAGFQDVPDYYLDALTANFIFRQGYRRVAKISANRLIEKDSDYILPRQLLLYTSLFLGEYSDVHKASEWLILNDEEHEQLYNFLDAIAYFEQKDYANAIIKFKNIRDERYFSDAKRYLLLLYVEIQDDKKINEMLEELLKIESLTPYDFYTVFDLIFYKPLRERKEMVFFSKYFKTAKKYLDVCYAEIGGEYTYICFYGKTGVLLANDQEEKAYQYLQRLINWYPKGFVYEALGDIAYRGAKYSEAKKWFMRAVSVGNDEERKSLIEKVREMVEKK